MPFAYVSYLTALKPAKRARQTRSSIRSILLALDIGDGCRQCLGKTMQQRETYWPISGLL